MKNTSFPVPIGNITWTIERLRIQNSNSPGVIALKSNSIWTRSLWWKQKATFLGKARYNNNSNHGVCWNLLEFEQIFLLTIQLVDQGNNSVGRGRMELQLYRVYLDRLWASWLSCGNYWEQQANVDKKLVVMNNFFFFFLVYSNKQHSLEVKLFVGVTTDSLDDKMSFNYFHSFLKQKSWIIKVNSETMALLIFLK